MFGLIALIDAAFCGLRFDIKYLVKSFDLKVEPGVGHKGCLTPYSFVENFERYLLIIKRTLITRIIEEKS